MRLVILPIARAEIDAALEWSKGTFGSSAAARLQRRFEQIGKLLMREPALGAPAFGSARELPLGKFPYTLVYRVQGEVITVIALAHQSRKPRYWRRR